MQRIQMTRVDVERATSYVASRTEAKHLAPIVDALANGVNVFILPAVKTSIHLPKKLYRKPFIALIGDDLFTAEGPSAFHLRTLRKLFATVQAVYVMSGPINKMAYAAAADGALAGLRTLIIETRESEEPSWFDYAQRHAPRAAITIPTPNWPCCHDEQHDRKGAAGAGP